MKEACLWGVGVLLGVMVLGWLLVLQPAYDTMASEKADIQSLSARLAQLSAQTFQTPALPAVATVAITAGVQPLLQTARESGVTVNVLESPPVATPLEGIHVGGEASLPAFLHWLDRLAMNQDTFQLKRTALTGLANGRLEFSFYALPVIGDGIRAQNQAPLVNPFCRGNGLSIAEASAKVPDLQRYPLSDESYLGVAKFDSTLRALIGVPGGGLQDVGVGDQVGEEQATVTGMTDAVLTLKTTKGDVLIKQKRGQEDGV